MATETTSTRPQDPLLNCNFLVEIDSLVVAGFNEVSGLSLEIETEPFNEGGVNDYVHMLPKNVKYQNITLKQGITNSEVLFNWVSQAMNGVIKKKNARIILQDFKRISMWCWNVESAFPVKWSGSDLKANGVEVFMESLELAHSGIIKKKMAS